MHLHPVFAICVFPVLVFLCLVSMPHWNQSALAGGVWFGGDRGKKLAFVTSTISVVLTVVVVILDDMVANVIGKPATRILTRGILPLLTVLNWYCLGYYILTSKFRYNRGEAVMAGFIFMVILMICLTIIGIWFRGPGMQLVFPFK
jgi:hypothetical protein